MIFGTRPEAVKLGPLAAELRQRPGLEASICLTGQHAALTRPALDLFGLRPDYRLPAPPADRTLAELTARVLTGVDAVLTEARPDLVLCHGDTTSALAGALAAFYRGIPVGHVEAGLRTRRLDSPFPEELNRQTVDRLSALRFAPTETARRNLLAEGLEPESVFVTGNTVIDVLRFTLRQPCRHPALAWAEAGRTVFLTLHRRESWGEPMAAVLRGVRRVLDAVPDARVLAPLHPNPRVRAALQTALGDHERVRLCEPLELADCHHLLARCSFVLTDSGGLQEEAPGLGKPVLVAREVTERPEGIGAGVLRLVGTGEESVFRECLRLLTDRAASRAVNPYGDGFAARRIADILEGKREGVQWNGAGSPG